MINVLIRGILDLDLDTLTKDVITMPLEIFTCKTIVKLKLGSLVKFAMVPENAYLPSLKTLFFFVFGSLVASLKLFFLLVLCLWGCAFLFSELNT